MLAVFNFGSRHRLRLVFLAAAAMAALLCASCAPPAADTAVASKQLIRLDEAWSKAASTRNADSVGAYYADTAIAYPPGEVAAVGRAAATRVWAAGFADSTYNISWKTTHAEVAKSGELGYTSGTYEESMRGPEARMMAVKGKYVCVWAKQADGGWKAVQDIWNADSK